MLTDIGLSENEATVYIASISIGPSTILELSKETSLPRTTVYGIVEQLKKSGIMFKEVKGFKHRYTAERPDKLSKVFKNRYSEFEKNIPELEKIYGSKEGDTTIKTYEGINAIKGVYEDLLSDIKPGEEYLVLSDQEQWQKIDKDYFTKFLERRAKLPIKIKMLLQDSPAARHSLKYQRNYNAEVRILPNRVRLTTNLIIIPKRVVVHQITSPIFAMTMENKNIINMHRESFNIMWESGLKDISGL